MHIVFTVTIFTSFTVVELFVVNLGKLLLH